MGLLPQTSLDFVHSGSMRPRPRNGSPLAIVLGCLAAVGALAPAQDVFAQGASSTAATKHPVVIYTEGTRPKDAEAQIKETLPEPAALDANDAWKRAATKKGQKFPLGFTLTLESKRQAMLKRLGDAAKEVGIEVVIIGMARASKPSGSEILLLVLEAGKDTPSIEKVVKLGSGDAKAETEAALKDLYDSWAPPVVETPEKPIDGEAPDKTDPEKPDAPEDEWVRPENVFGHEIFQVAASFDLAGRFFEYSDGLSPNLRDYDVFGAPGLSANVSVYPLAPTGIVVLRDIGLYGDFRIALGLSSAAANGTEVSTDWMRFGGGLRYRLPLGPKDAPYVLRAHGGFYRDAFQIEETGELVGETPSTEYLFLKGGLDARIPIGPVAITLFGDYLGSLSDGLPDRFREPSIGGIDVGGGLTIPIVYGLEARLQAEYVRWFYAFEPVPGDDYVAGGALDQNVHIEIGPQYVF